MNHDAIDTGINSIVKIEVPASWKDAVDDHEEKAAEKATGRTEAKGGIHGKLEKAKAEIKAKGTDTIPKNRAKDLASVL